MANPKSRLSLRITQNNPIFSVPARERSRIADEWLRRGADIQQLERLITQLESIIRQADKPTQPIINTQAKSDKKPNVAAVLAAFD